MSFLITGGMGAVGAFVARNLVERGLEPILYSRHKNTVLISDIQDRVIIVEGNILDSDKLVKTIKKYRVELTCLAMIQVARTLGISNTEIVEKWSSASRLLTML